MVFAIEPSSVVSDAVLVKDLTKLLLQVRVKHLVDTVASRHSRHTLLQVLGSPLHER